jgi:predicted AAA+ superfamily ATPase
MNYIKRVFAEPAQSFFLFGPRGTGKSTMAAQHHPQALLIDLQLVEFRYRLTANPDQLKELVSAQLDSSIIIIDEIQKIPELLSVVHLMACELNEQFNLKAALLYGLLLLRFDQPNSVETLQAYISLYLKEKVKTEGLIRNYESFTRFLEGMSFSHRSILTIPSIARACYAKRTMVNDLLSILEDLLICYQLPVFNHKAKRALSAHPKFYFFDAGVYRALRPRSVVDRASKIDGAGGC